jgi:ADP-heptose:LPS heptosyltransferase
VPAQESSACSERRHAVVLFSVSYLGDLVLATLTFDSLVARSGGPLEIVTAPAPAPILAADPRVASIRTVRSSHPIVWRVEVARELLRARRRRALVVNLEVYAPRWRFLRALCRSTRTESCELDLPVFLEDERNAACGRPVLLPHRSWHYARAVGIENGVPPPRLFISELAHSSVKERLRRLVREDVALVVAHPGSSDPARRAPLALFAETLRGLATRHNVVTIGVGTAAERPLLDSLAQHFGASASFVSWAGDLTVAELVALLADADLFIGNDSGPLKIAEPAGTPTVSFWGPSSARFAGPRGNHHRVLEFNTPVNEAVTAACALLGSSHVAGFRSTS